jgi:hypothetical protein
MMNRNSDLFSTIDLKHAIAGGERANSGVR